jgi:hypothetical protein
MVLSLVIISRPGTGSVRGCENAGRPGSRGPLAARENPETPGMVRDKEVVSPALCTTT